MRNQPLHEVAKFAAGLVAADFFSIVWFSQQKLLPVHFMGTTFDASMILPALVFDAAIFAMLVHYAWRIGTIPGMREKSYLMVAGLIFTVVGLVHLWRLFASADLIIGGWAVPLWLSWFGVAATVYLAYMSFHLAARVRR